MWYVTLCLKVTSYSMFYLFYPVTCCYELEDGTGTTEVYFEFFVT